MGDSSLRLDEGKDFVVMFYNLLQFGEICNLNNFVVDYTERMWYNKHKDSRGTANEFLELSFNT